MTQAAATPRDTRVTLAPRPASLLGERVVFTGRLASMDRDEAARAVAAAGGRVATRVSERTTMVVVGMRGWPLLSSGRLTNPLAEAERLRSQGRRITVLGEAAFRERIGLDLAEAAGVKPLALAQVATALGVPPVNIERWEQLGLVRSSAGCFDFRDLVSLRTITELVAKGVNPTLIRESLEGLRDLLPGVDRPLAQLNILVAAPGRLVAELGDALLGPDGQWELNFDRSEAMVATQHAVIHAVNSELDADLASELVEEGLLAEDRGEFDLAEECYQRASRADPHDPSPHFNLGNVLLTQHRYEEAAEQFSQALSLDPDHTRALFNAAHVHEAMGQPREALRCLRRAVTVDPGFVDAHFNLADLCDRLEMTEAAQRAWEDYLRLDPVGPWADEARRRLNWPTRRPA
jgi:tetratricopeptide (TPR) repeat protein